MVKSRKKGRTCAHQIPRGHLSLGSGWSGTATRRTWDPDLDKFKDTVVTVDSPDKLEAKETLCPGRSSVSRTRHRPEPPERSRDPMSVVPLHLSWTETSSWSSPVRDSERSVWSGVGVKGVDIFLFYYSWRIPTILLIYLVGVPLQVMFRTVCHPRATYDRGTLVRVPWKKVKVLDTEALRWREEEGDGDGCRTLSMTPSHFTGLTSVFFSFVCPLRIVDRRLVSNSCPSLLTSFLNVNPCSQETLEDEIRDTLCSCYWDIPLTFPHVTSEYGLFFSIVDLVMTVGVSGSTVQSDSRCSCLRPFDRRTPNTTTPLTSL